MVPRMFSTSGWLTTLLWRYAREGHAPNILLAKDVGKFPGGVFLNDERMVAVVRTHDDRELVLTSRRILEHGQTVIGFDEVARCHHMTDHLDQIDSRHPRAFSRFKLSHYQRLLLDTTGGRRIVLDHLGPAVYPLLRFFRSIANEQAETEPAA